MRLFPIGRRGALLGALAGLAAAATPGAPIPIDRSKGGCLMPVTLDGRMAHMLLDTGAEQSVITRAAVARLGLRPDRWVATTLRGAGGLLERHANVDVAAAQAGGITLYQRQPGEGLSLPVTSSDLGGVDGLLGGDVLRHYTLDLDLPHAQLVLRAAPVAPAAPGAVALQLLRRDLLLAPVRLDGHDLMALVDTGASLSLINARGAYRIGLTPERTAHDPIVPMMALGGTSPARLHRFAELRIGAFSVSAPLMLSEPVPEPAFDLVLGLDMLGRQRLHLSYPGRTLEFGAGQ